MLDSTNRFVAGVVDPEKYAVAIVPDEASFPGVGIELLLVPFDVNESSRPDHSKVFEGCLLIVKSLVRCDLLQRRVWSSVG